MFEAEIEMLVGEMIGVQEDAFFSRYSKYYIFESWLKQNPDTNNSVEGARSAAELLEAEYFKPQAGSSLKRQENAAKVFEVMSE